MIWQLAHMHYHAPLQEFTTFSSSYYSPSLIAYNNVKTVDDRPVSTVGDAIRAFSETAKIVAYEDRHRVPFYIRTYRSNDFIGQGCILRPTATNSTFSSNGTISIPSDQQNSSLAGKFTSPDADFPLTYLRYGVKLAQNKVLLMVSRAIALDAHSTMSWYIARDENYYFQATVPDLQIYLKKAWQESPLRNKNVVDALRSMAFSMWENNMFAEADVDIRTTIAGRQLRIATLQIRHRIAEEGLATN